jgi:DNA-directed RNA polymerase specialized sigma24 family protein
MTTYRGPGRDRLEPDDLALANALSRLRRVDRLVLLLSARRKLSYASIGRRLNITPRDAQRRLARALRTLDRLLDDGR